MSIAEMLQQIANLSVGLDQATAYDNTVNLRYLNLAHQELYRTTAAVNPDAKITQKTIAVVDGKLQEKIQAFLIKSLYIAMPNNTNILTPVAYDWILSHDPTLTQACTTSLWYRLNQALYTYPKYTGELTVVFVDEPEALTLETEEAAIPYPLLYHSVLVDGACYFAFQSESGLKNKQELLLTLARWDEGKKDCLSYLVNQSNYRVISTYSEV